MKLKKILRDNSGRRGEVSISFRKSGSITISTAAEKLIGLKAKDHIDLFQDEEEPSDWYLHKSKEGCLTLRHPNGNPDHGGGLATNASSICYKFRVSLGLEDYTENLRCLISRTPVTENKMELWPLLTASVKGVETNDEE
jgi:hypothetical protein